MLELVRIKRVVSTMLVAFAVCAPVAHAAVIDPPVASNTSKPADPGQGVQTQQVAFPGLNLQGDGSARDGGGGSAAASGESAVRSVQVSSPGFDWGDAGIGAAATLAMLGLGAGIAVGRRNGRHALTS